MAESIRTADDSELISLYEKRSENAIVATAVKYGNYCNKIAMNILVNKSDAEECLNDTYLSVWNSIPPQKPSVFCAFIGRITRNIALNRYKAMRTGKRGGGTLPLILDELTDCVSSAADVEDEFDAGQTGECITEFLHELPFEQRSVFVRRYFYSDSIADVASRFNISESKVKSMLMRLRNKLKIHLEKEGVFI